MRASFICVAAALAVLGLVSATHAQSGGDYEMTWYTVDGGGVTAATGGDCQVGATVGQPEMTVQIGGDYTVESGFWFASAGGARPTAGSLRYGMSTQAWVWHGARSAAG